jgi:FixJ family two-component response regulator
MEIRGRQIVLVEDHAGVRLAIDRLLQAAGFEVASFASAEELLSSAAAQAAACFVLDIQLPGLSGFDLSDRLRFSGEPPVIFITAFDDPASRAHAERLGATAYLPKPFLGHSLLAALERAIEKAG